MMVLPPDEEHDLDTSAASQLNKSNELICHTKKKRSSPTFSRSLFIGLLRCFVRLLRLKNISGIEQCLLIPFTIGRWRWSISRRYFFVRFIRSVRHRMN